MEFTDAVDGNATMEVDRDEYGTFINVFDDKRYESAGIYLSDDQVKALIQGIRDL